MKVYEAVKSSFKMIDEMETLRSKLLYIVDSTNSNKTKKSQAAKLENDLWKLEGRVHDVFQTGAREDIFRNPAKLLERLLAIQKESAFGSADFQPTDQDVEVYTQLKSDLDNVLSDYADIKKSVAPLKSNLKIRNKINTSINKK